MHICFLTSEFPKAGFPHGGVGTFVKTISEALVENGVDVSVIGLNYIPDFEESVIEGVKIIRLPASRIKGLAWYFNSKLIAKTIAKLDKTNPIDVIEGAELSLAFLPKIKEIKYFIRLHGGHHFFAEAENRGINWWKGFQEKKSFCKADAFIAVSEYVKNHTEKYLSFHDKPIAKIFYPINLKLFQTQDIPVDLKNITFAGTICEKKGVRQLIKSFQFVKKKMPDAQLHLYGRDWLFPDGTSYIKMLQEIELPKLGAAASDILFHGSVPNDEIIKVYAKAAVCVFPSHMETLGLVAPEAMAMEKAVIFTCLGPGPEVIEDGKTGLLCNPYDPKNIADKILIFLDDQAMAVECGKKARDSVLRQFGIKKIVLQNIEFYKSVKS